MSVEMSKALNHMANAKTIDELRKNIYQSLPIERQVFARLSQFGEEKRLELRIPYTNEELLDSEINFFSKEKTTWVDPNRAKCYGLSFEYSSVKNKVEFTGSTYAPTHNGLDSLLKGYIPWKDLLVEELHLEI